MMMVPYQETNKIAKVDTKFSKEYYNSLLLLGKSNAFDSKGQILVNGKPLLGSNLFNLLGYIYGKTTIKPRHLIAFKNILEQQGMSKSYKNLKSLEYDKGKPKKVVVNRNIVKHDPDSTIIADWIESDDD